MDKILKLENVVVSTPIYLDNQPHVIKADLDDLSFSVIDWCESINLYKVATVILRDFADVSVLTHTFRIMFLVPSSCYRIFKLLEFDND